MDLAQQNNHQKVILFLTNPINLNIYTNEMDFKDIIIPFLKSFITIILGFILLSITSSFLLSVIIWIFILLFNVYFIKNKKNIINYSYYGIWYLFIKIKK